jgi:DNA-binding transcriptional MerR regulator
MTDSSAPEILDIAEVVRRTGLTSRALRFYEARGLFAPLRTASNRRAFGPRELERLHQIVVLKRAGLSLSQIAALFAGRPPDLARIVGAQIAMIDDEADRLVEARRILAFALSRLERSEPIDAATFCSLIETGDKVMNTEPEAWRKVTDRYFTADEKARWAKNMANMPAEFDQADYAAKWKNLGARIKAALPLDPAGETAQAFAAEWKGLLAPFNAVATPEMRAGAQRLYERMDEWEGEADPGFDTEVFDLIKRALAAKH